MASDPLMAGYIPLIATQHGVFNALDYPARIRGVVPGKTEQEISIHPEIPLNFGSVVNGQVSQPFWILIINRGYKAITVDSIQVLGDFILGAVAEMTVQPGDVLDVPVMFSPKRTGAHTGALYVTAGNASGERFLKLIGTGS